MKKDPRGRHKKNWYGYDGVIAYRLRKARKEANLTTRGLKDFHGSHTSITNWENLKHKPQEVDFIELSQIYKKPLMWLMAEDYQRIEQKLSSIIESRFEQIPKVPMHVLQYKPIDKELFVKEALSLHGLEEFKFDDGDISAWYDAYINKCHTPRVLEIVNGKTQHNLENVAEYYTALNNLLKIRSAEPTSVLETYPLNGYEALKYERFMEAGIIGLTKLYLCELDLPLFNLYITDELEANRIAENDREFCKEWKARINTITKQTEVLRYERMKPYMHTMRDILDDGRETSLEERIRLLKFFINNTNL